MIATGPVEPVTIPPVRRREGNRRTRIAAEVDPQLRDWLRRAVRAHAHICATVRRFGDPSTAGGASLRGDEYSERIARGDRTVLFDCVTYCIEELAGIRCSLKGTQKTHGHRPDTRPHPPFGVDPCRRPL